MKERDDPNVRWRSIKGFEDYEVSEYGLVYSKKRKRILKNRTKNNYIYVFLYNEDGRKQKAVHRLVAEAFLENPYHYPQINHKDENPANNCVDNLEWCTSKYNCNYGTHNRKISERLKQYNPWKGKCHSEESKRKMSQAKKGIASKRKRKVMIQGVEYESVTQAMDKLNICTRRIYKLLKEEELCTNEFHPHTRTR